MAFEPKLVRDCVPALIRAEGRTPVTRVLARDEYIVALLAKLHEETAELAEWRSLEELADVLEVVLALADMIGSREDLERMRREKFAARGGFAGRVWLERAE